jgi:hypothetical protein
MHHPQRFLEDHCINNTNHLPRPHFTQITATLAGRAGGILFGQHIEGFALGDALFELLGFFRGFHQNMAGLSFHGASTL